MRTGTLGRRLEIAAGVECGAQCGGIGEVECAAARESEADAGDFYLRELFAEFFSNEVAGGFAFDIVGKGENEFLDIACFETFFQRGEIQIFRTDTAYRGKASVENVERAAKRSRALDCHQVGNLFDDAEPPAFPPRIRTNRAKLRVFCDVSAAFATRNMLGGVSQRPEQRGKALRMFHKQVQSHAFCGTKTDARKFLQGVACGIKC